MKTPQPFVFARAWRSLHLALLIGLTILVAGCSSPTEKAQAYYEKGMELYEQGDLVKAALEFKNALQINKDMADAWYGLSLVEEKRGKWPAVFKLLNKVVNLQPEHVDANIRLGSLYLAAGKLDEALKQSQKVIGLAPQNPDALSFSAAVLFKLDDTKGAVEQANAALAIDPNHVDSLIVLASERLAEGDSAAAIALMDRGLQENTGSVAMQLVKLQALEKLGDTGEMEAVLKRLGELYPDNRGFRHALAKFYLREKRSDEAEAIYRAIAEENPGDWEARLDLVRFVNTIRSPAAAEQELKQYIEKVPGEYPPWFALAELYLSQGDQAKGLETLQEIVSRAGTSESGLDARARLAALKLSDDKKASMALVDEILAVDPRHSDALVLKATVDIDARALDEAIAGLRTVLRDSPGSARALLLLAKAHEAQGADELADDHFVRAFEAANASTPVGMSYVSFLIQRNRIDRAAGILEDILAREPASLPALKALAQVKLAQADWVRAEAIAQRIRELGDEEGISKQILGAAYAGQKKYDASIQAFREAQQSAPGAVQPMVSLVRAYVRAGRMADAQAFVEAVLKSSPENPVARSLQAQLFLLQDRPADAEQTLAELVRLSPENPLGYRSLAALYTRAGKVSQAQEILGEGLKTLPADFDLLLTRAGVNEVAGDYEAAIADYETLYEERPNSDIVANNLASLLAEHRDDQASLQRALELAKRFRRSEVPHFQDTLGWAHYRLGDAEESRNLLEGTVKADPNLAIFRYHLGMSYLALNERESAREQLSKALELAGDGESEQARKIREALNAL